MAGTTQTGASRDEVRNRVEDVRSREGVGVTEAIRRVAAELGRSVPAVRSAYYAAARDEKRTERDIYAEMLPLIEAGLSPEQAALRVGAAKTSEHLAEGFTRWARARGVDVPSPRPRRAGRAASADDGRLAELEQENHRLREELETARRALARIADIADDARQ